MLRPWARRRIGVITSSIVLASALAAATPVSALITDEARPARRADVEILQYNVHQGRDGDIVGKLTAQVQHDRPDVVTLNELCRYDFEGLAANLKRLGYSAQFTVSHRASLGCRAFEKGWDQGVAVYVTGPAVDGSADSFHIGQGVACLTADTRPRIRACSVHLTSPQDATPPGDSGVAVQVNELRRTVMAEPDLPLVIAGDFNLPPWDRSMQRLYDDYYEVGMDDGACAPWPWAAVPVDATRYGGHCTFEHSRQGGKKIDYAFVDKHHFASVAAMPAATMHGAGCYGDYLGYRDACSDHRQLRGSASVEVSDLALRSWGIRMWAGDARFDPVQFGEVRASGEIVNLLERMLGRPTHTIDVAAVDDACATDVDRYVVWGSGTTPTLALALSQADGGAAVVGYRLYHGLPKVVVGDHVSAGSSVGAWELPAGWAGEQCGLSAVPDAAQAAAAAGDVPEPMLYLQRGVSSDGRTA